MRHDRPDGQGELARLEGTNFRLVGEARVLVAIVAMGIVLLDRPSQLSYVIFPILFAYSVYSACLMLWARKFQSGWAVAHCHWIDASCCFAVVALSGDITQKYFLLALFPIGIVSLQFGLRRGASAAIGCAVLLAGIGAAHAWLDPDTTVEKLPLWPVFLMLTLGLVIARWGNSEFTLRRRLAFLHDLNALAGSGNDLARAMRSLAEMLRAYQGADACIVIMKDPQSDGYLLCEADDERSDRPTEGERIGTDAANPLLGSANDVAMVYSRRRHWWQRTVASAYDRVTLESRPPNRAELDQLANLLETDSFITVPIYFRQRPIGRLYGLSRRFRYVSADLGFLQQVVGQAALVIENIQLLDRLATEVASQERQKISRDLHDGTIQPYIGLKLALEALRRRVPNGTPVALEVDDLARMASEGIAELRRYVAGLRGEGAKSSQESLLMAVRRHAEKFTEYYGINVHVIADGDVRLKTALVNEVMNIVREGLANIRRHTSAQSAVIKLREEEGRLVVQFINESTPGRGTQAFFSPRSLKERASELGGQVDVENRADGRTLVAVAIPV